MFIYNTLTRRKEKFKPLHKNRVGLYTCGPTVYNYAHLGNLRTYIFEDLLERALEWNGYKVKRVMNITDVGHLTSDADAGEDKIEREAKKEKKSVWDIVKFYTRSFFKDLKALNIKKPAYVAPATKFIPEQIALIEKLFRRGFAYETSKAIYFDVSRFKNYTQLSRQKLSEKIAAARKEIVLDKEKHSPHDFALWFKLVDRFQNHIMRWKSPWGLGFPGWHIECSAISSSLLGQPFDIHTGGVDHISVHHTNEIAQSEGAYGKPLAKYWMHGEFLIVQTKRMGKSAGNFITLDDLKKKGFDPLSFRYFTLGAHYRSKLNFSWEALGSAEQGLRNLRESISNLRSLKTSKKAQKDGGQLKAYREKFKKAVENDLNIPQALAVLWEVIKSGRLSPKSKLLLALDFDKVLGLNLQKIKKPEQIPTEIKKLVRERELFRANKQFIEADALRKKLRSVGYEVEDTPLGPTIRRINRNR